MSLLFMALRFWCKRRYHKVIGLDDYILIFSWMLLALYVALTIASTRWGVGRHLDSVSLDDSIAAGRLLFVAEFFAILAVAVSKTSFAVTLLRFAFERWHRVFLWSVIVSVNMAMWSCAALLLAQCQPTEKLWDVELDGSCWPRAVYTAYSIFAGSWSAAMDFALAIFPWVLIWPMRIQTAEKIGVGIAMSLGVLAGVTAVIKTTFLPMAGKPKSDFTYVSTDLIIWAAAEAAVIISAASIPFMRPLLLNTCRSIRGRHIALRGEIQGSRDSTQVAGSETGRWTVRREVEHSHWCVLKKIAERGGGITSSATRSSNTQAMD
ncbi:hypothetical protein MYCTH_2297381 [Thermothelomyces thermophilus ATCC 42464]|uniref:Rhodopsin domain-containing protein n=1 Tax=Thermothelomyces thermophilus (strain ATCC 42464 / BCRC 31852 / DSM 1799) TaxID=573729 RepID=G2Q5J6_THET4|nr:uncharacterized protein MYCTH_2297381 [Thermothelomyces thermophilus ATCC 42464]AEO54629.1 hypothetical protein MYCTH_2297381 [Thermothelomyces thermophilus ATCC 42464]